YFHAEATPATDGTRLPGRFKDAASWLSGLVGLGCTSSRWPESYLAGVLSLSELVGLQALDLFGGDFGSEVANAIEEAEHLTNLRVLDLSGCEIEDETLGVLANAGHLRSVVALRLGAVASRWNQFTPDGIASLTHSRHLVNLSQLHLDQTEI